jgi:hypothetical protein
MYAWENDRTPRIRLGGENAAEFTKVGSDQAGCFDISNPIDITFD